MEKIKIELVGLEKVVVTDISELEQRCPDGEPITYSTTYERVEQDKWNVEYSCSAGLGLVCPMCGGKRMCGCKEFHTVTTKELLDKLVARTASPETYPLVEIV